jgi:hypothetical protein
MSRIDPLEPFAIVSYSGSNHEPKTPSGPHTCPFVCSYRFCSSIVRVWVGKDSRNSARSIGGRGLLGRLSATN